MMIYLAWFVVFFTVLQWLIALTNLVLSSRLPEGDHPDKPLVSVLIPARNEEHNIGNILNDLAVQEYRNIEVIVFDDQSDDRTPEIVKGMAEKDSRIKLSGTGDLPEGWTGKNRACHVLPGKSRGE